MFHCANFHGLPFSEEAAFWVNLSAEITNVSCIRHDEFMSTWNPGQCSRQLFWERG
jgi:hypothetical protein